MLLAEASGLDPGVVYDAVRSGAGNSRIFELRAPMMIAGRYTPATMKMDRAHHRCKLRISLARRRPRLTGARTGAISIGSR